MYQEDKKNILFITESYYHNPSPNGNCVRKVAETLVDVGYKVSVLALKNQFVKKDEEINGVKVYRVNTYAEWRVSFEEKLPRYVRALLSRMFRWIKYVFIPLHPFRSPGVLYRLYCRGGKIICENNIDVIVSVYRDFETALAGTLLKYRFPNKKYVIYTLDAISGGVCSNCFVSTERHVGHCRKWEAFFMKRNDLFCAMKSHEHMLGDTYYAPYKKKIIFLDIPNLIINDIDYSTQKADDSIHFVFTGMLSETNADCRYFLKVFQKICSCRNVFFDIYGGMSKEIQHAINATGLLGDRISFYGIIPQEKLDTVRKKADIFVNFGNNHACGIPCKIFEYVSTGKMIVSFYKIDHDASYPYLSRYRKAILLKEQSGREAEYGRGILEFYDKNRDVEISKAEIKQSYFDNTPFAFVEMLSKIENDT